jgi:hypothetical protein
MPAPEPRSATRSPSLICANFVGAPHPTPKMEDCGIDSRSSASYPII